MLSLVLKFVFLLWAFILTLNAPGRSFLNQFGVSAAATRSVGKPDYQSSGPRRKEADRASGRPLQNVDESVLLLVFGVVVFVVATGIKVKLPRKHLIE